MLKRKSACDVNGSLIGRKLWINLCFWFFNEIFPFESRPITCSLWKQANFNNY